MIYIMFYEKIKKYTLILLLSIFQITSPQQVFTTYLNIYLPVYLQNLLK